MMPYERSSPSSSIKESSTVLKLLDKYIPVNKGVFFTVTDKARSVVNELWPTGWLLDPQLIGGC